MKDLIKNLIKQGKLNPQLRIEVYPILGLSEAEEKDITTKYKISSDELWDLIKEYQKIKENNNVFGFFDLKTFTPDELTITIKNGKVHFS